jgi:hypothetical protein
MHVVGTGICREICTDDCRALLCRLVVVDCLLVYKLVLAECETLQRYVLNCAIQLLNGLHGVAEDESCCTLVPRV